MLDDCRMLKNTLSCLYCKLFSQEKGLKIQFLIRDNYSVYPKLGPHSGSVVSIITS